jgi:hypothetical protein
MHAPSNVDESSQVVLFRGGTGGAEPLAMERSSEREKLIFGQEKVINSPSSSPAQRSRFPSIFPSCSGAYSRMVPQHLRGDLLLGSLGSTGRLCSSRSEDVADRISLTLCCACDALAGPKP